MAGGMFKMRYFKAILFSPPLAFALYYRQELQREEETGLSFYDLYFNDDKLEQIAKERAEKELVSLLSEEYDRSSAAASSLSSSSS
eukprot:CAMPEP_0201518786 /NCGR_PEP_ID=MMETSP0161_2-20130828/9527_1 /ASSEMBLY_ACC=CAM_ASM_000251 /TAXON_ID=180227 /ORGANISM="Neoparamoeba aestuarina, Strain SoJaBio B1-5/56/2" /LENGTH=85 /DNA_ID=CAMNT_0047916651 /DNA_START=60 /DNA_END=314 /DNA_ORIENTATION=-